MDTPISIATGILVRHGQVLMVHRHPLREAFPDCWGLPGGHVEPGESPRQAVVRECLEELGVHVHDPLPISMTVAAPGLEMHAFLITRWVGEPANIAPVEHDDLRWFRPGDLRGVKMAHPEGTSSIVDAVQIATG